MTIALKNGLDTPSLDPIDHHGHNWDTRTDAVQVLNPAPKLRNARRHRRLKRIAWALVTADFSASDLVAFLLNYNEVHCEPPLSERTVLKIAAAALFAKEVL
jgi:hypothetical protein